jgi:predicted DNA-binding transcriptional regulator YafY
MSLLKYVERLKRMDDLIRRKATGTPDQFAEKLGISKSMLMINLNELKELGAPIKFNNIEQAYCYEKECSLLLQFELTKQDASALKGGKNSFNNFIHSNTVRMEDAMFTVQVFES